MDEQLASLAAAVQGLAVDHVKVSQPPAAERCANAPSGLRGPTARTLPRPLHTPDTLYTQLRPNSEVLPTDHACVRVCVCPVPTACLLPNDHACARVRACLQLERTTVASERANQEARALRKEVRVCFKEPALSLVLSSLPHRQHMLPWTSP